MIKHDRSEWTRGGEGPRFIKGRHYRQLVEFSRPCQQCGERFSIYVTRPIANEEFDSNVFGLKNCELHRKNRVNALLKNKLQKMPWEA